jgi:uncharacterized membrane protein YqjE
MANGEIHANGRRVSEILTDMKAEFAEFVQTRIAMLRTELRDSVRRAKVAIPLMGVAALLLWTAFLLFTGALVGLVVAAFPHSLYRWFFACLLVGFFWGIIGAAAAYFALRELRSKSIMPKRTLQVLKGDKMWIESEVRNRYERATG